MGPRRGDGDASVLGLRRLLGLGRRAAGRCEELGGGFAAGFGEAGGRRRGRRLACGAPLPGPLRPLIAWGEREAEVGEGLGGLGLGGGSDEVGAEGAQPFEGGEALGEPFVGEDRLELGEGEAVDLAEVEEGEIWVEQVADEVGGGEVGGGVGGVGWGRH